MTPLHLAARKGYNSIIRRLVVEHSALLDAFTLTKQTPLHLAAEAGQLQVCEALLSMKADVIAIDNVSYLKKRKIFYSVSILAFSNTSSFGC